MKLYGDLKSGNCLKVVWTADRLGLAYSFVPVDIMAGESRTPEFLALSLMGQVPVIDFGDGKVLAQSNAILRYLALGTELLPDDPFVQAQCDQWLFWEQYSHEPYIAVCRFHMAYQGKSKESREPDRVARGEKALDLMEQHLAGRDWFVGPTLTIADIALVAYTRFADEGGFDLTTRPNVRAWIARCDVALKLLPHRGSGL